MVKKHKIGQKSTKIDKIYISFYNEIRCAYGILRSMANLIEFKLVSFYNNCVIYVFPSTLDACLKKKMAQVKGR